MEVFNDRIGPANEGHQLLVFIILEAKHLPFSTAHAACVPLTFCGLKYDLCMHGEAIVAL